MERLGISFIARRLVLVVCAATLVATLGGMELFSRWDAAHRDTRLAQDALERARSLAVTIDELNGDRIGIVQRVRLWSASNPDVAAVEFLDAQGKTLWSSSTDARLDGRARPAMSAIVASDGWIGTTNRSALRRAFVPLRSNGVAFDGKAAAVGTGTKAGAKVAAKAAAPRPPQALVVALTWDIRRERIEHEERHASLLVAGALLGIALGLLIYLISARALLDPLDALARAAGRADLIADDLAPSVARTDAIGAVARGMARLRQDAALQAEAARDAQAQLQGALSAGDDGIALARHEDGRWRIVNANDAFARFVGQPRAWIEGREAVAVFAQATTGLADGEGVRRWCEHALVEAAYEGSRACAAANDSVEWGLSELSTRPLHDNVGRLIGRLWHVRDVTRTRDHEHRLKRQNQELATLDLMARRVSRSLDETAVLAAALETLREVFGGPSGAVLVALPRSCDLHVTAQRGEDAAEGLAAALLPWRGRFEEGEIVHEPTIAVDGALRAALPQAARSWVGIPLRDGGGLVAVLLLARGRTQPFVEDEVSLLRRLAHPVEAALENARLFARTQAQLIENQTLFEVSRSVGRADELDDLLSDILRVVDARLDHRNAAILLPDDGGRSLYVRASVGYHGDLAGLELPLDGPSVTAVCFRTGHVVNVPDVRAHAGYVAASDDIRSELALPLKIGERVLGILDVESDRRDAFGPDDERLLSAVANQAAIVLHNASLLAETRARATRFEAVSEIARAVSATLDPRRLERAIVSQLARLVPSERYAMLRYDHERRRTLRAVVLDGKTNLAHDGDALSWPFDDGLDPATLVPHRAEWLPNLAVDAGRAAAESRHVAHGVGALVLVPIALDGRVAAAIVAASTRPHAFTAEHLRLLEIVSYHVGAALKNAELYSRLQASYVQLNEAQDGLVRSEKLRALGEMASGVAHDFNNVLGAILGRAQLLRARLGESELAAELEIIEKAARDGASTVRRLQDFTRVRTDREFEPVALQQVIEDSISLTRGRWRDEAERAGLSYELTTSLEPTPRVAGQASELREVLTNLILNALDAMPRGGALALSTRQETNPVGTWIVVEVEDTGDGMPEPVRARIFDPFFTTKGVRGVGLGLSVVYGIVQRHGGRIEVDTIEGQGTTMRIHLPACETGVGEEPAPPPIHAAPAVGAPLRILVVDDEPSVRTLLADLLRTAGHEAVETASGAEARARLDEDPDFDLVLTDLGMPELTGWDVARAIGERPSPPPVVLVTGWGIQLDDALLASSGVASVIAKPFTIEEVLSAVEAIGRRAA
jgi:signal transduction histidine kinase